MYVSTVNAHGTKGKINIVNILEIDKKTEIKFTPIKETI